MKKWIITVLSVICAISCVAFAACKKDPVTPDDFATPPVDKTLAFNEDAATLKMFEDLQLLFTAENIYGELEFTSSDDTKATVDKSGKVSGVGVGNATITVSGDGLTDTIAITVDNYDASKLSFQSKFITANVYETESADLGLTLLYDGKPVKGGTFTANITGDAATYEGGAIKGVSQGDASVKITASFNGVNLGEITVSVSVTEKLELFAEENVTVYISEGKNEQNANTTFASLATVKLNNKQVENADIKYSIEDDSVVTIENGVIKAKKVGKTKITASYTTAKNTKASKIINVEVKKPVATFDLDKINFTKNKDTFTFDFTDAKYIISACNYVEPTKVEIDGATIDASNYSMTDGVLTVQNAAFANTLAEGTNTIVTDHVITVYAENEGESFIVSREYYLIDFSIGTSEEFVEFLTATSTGKPINAILTADIEYTDSKWTYSYVGDTLATHFKGILDGQGHTVDKVYMRNGIFHGINGATVKNIAFTNITTGANNAASLFAWNTSGKNLLENVLLHGDLSPVTGVHCAGISNNTASIEMKNVVVYVEFGKNTEFNAINRDGNLGSMSNVYAISTTAKNLANAVTVMGATLYTDAKAYASVANDKISEFDSTYWTTEGGVIMFKSAKAKLSAVSADTSMDKDVFVKVGETYYAVKGTYNVAVDGCTIIFESAVENVTFANGILTIGEEASIGSKVKVLAVDPIYGTVIDSVEVTVAAVQETTAKGGVVGKNRNDKLSLTFGSNLTAEDIKSVSFGGVAIKASDYTVTGNKIEIDSAKLVTKENGVLSVMFFKDGTIYNYSLTDVKVCDFAIGTAAEFNAWFAAVRATTYSGQYNNTTASKSYYAVMTANVNMQDVALTSTYNKNCCASGIFDGQGYAISNLKLDNTMFATMANFTMKNVAWKNVVNNANNYMLNTTSPAQTNDFINCYFEFESTPSQSQIWHIGSVIRNIENVVIVNNFTWSGQPVIRGGAPASIKNVFAISKNSSGVVNTLRSESTNPAENCGSFADVNALKAALEAENATVTLNGFTNNEYWDVTAGYPVWKTKNA